jgi:hypothetical protein
VESLTEAQDVGEVQDGENLTRNATVRSSTPEDGRSGRNQCRSAAAGVNFEDDVDASGVPQFSSTHGDDDEGEAQLLVFLDGREDDRTRGGSALVAVMVFGAVSRSGACREEREGKEQWRREDGRNEAARVAGLGHRWLLYAEVMERVRPIERCSYDQAAVAVFVQRDDSHEEEGKLGSVEDLDRWD